MKRIYSLLLCGGVAFGAQMEKKEEIESQSKTETTKRYFSGIGFGLNSLDVKKQDQVGSIILNHTQDEKATSFTFLGGINLSQNGRVYGNYEILNLDDLEIKSYYLSYDYIFPYFLSPYLGVSLGMADLKWQIDPLVNSQTKDDKLSSLLYGIQGGIEYPIENQLSIYSQISYQKLDFTTNLISTPAKSTITYESKKSFVVGLKYSF
jgi:opacity protein-like surface antigen